jgi:alkylmercury lyase
MSAAITRMMIDKEDEMDTLAFEQYMEETRNLLASMPKGAYEFELRIQVLALQLLAKGNPVSPESLADAWDMPLEQVNAIFEQAGAQGTLQLDDDGNMVGSYLSLIPTTHKLQVADKTLYAWCAYDAIYIPGVLGKKAVIESIDPYSHETVQLAISPNGEIDLKPEGIVVTVVGMDADTRGGADSPRCSQMHFFQSYENADKWSSDYADVSIMTVHQVFEAAREFQIEPARRIGLVE